MKKLILFSLLAVLAVGCGSRRYSYRVRHTHYDRGHRHRRPTKHTTEIVIEKRRKRPAKHSTVVHKKVVHKKEVHKKHKKPRRKPHHKYTYTEKKVVEKTKRKHRKHSKHEKTTRKHKKVSKRVHDDRKHSKHHKKKTVKKSKRTVETTTKTHRFYKSSR